MTPRECAKLQSLDTLKALPDSSPKAFAALGNAVNSNVVEQVALSLLSHYLTTLAHDGSTVRALEPEHA